MSLLATRRSRLIASAAAVLVTNVALLVPAGPALAAAMTITSVSPAKVGAGMGAQTMTITGTNFDASLIGGISVGADSNCAGLTNHVVTSRTQIVFRTPGIGCAVSPGGIPETISIWGTDFTTLLATKVNAVLFVPPPALADPLEKPVITDNSSLLDLADQVTALNAAGGQVIRIKAGNTFAFDGRSPAALSGTLNGRVLTSVGFRAPDGVTVQTGTAVPEPGNYWLARTMVPLPVVAASTLVLTQNTVSRTFAEAATGLTVVNAPVVTGLDFRAGKTGGATVTRIMGSGFGSSANDLTVTMCGKTAPIVGSPSSSTVTVQTPNPGGSPPTAVADLVAALGGTAGVCPVVVTRTTGSETVSSPVTTATYFTFLDR